MAHLFGGLSRSACRQSLTLSLPNKCGAVVQLVRTLACHARGRGFESRRLRFPPEI